MDKLFGRVVALGRLGALAVALWRPRVFVGALRLARAARFGGTRM